MDPLLVFFALLLLGGGLFLVRLAARAGPAQLDGTALRRSLSQGRVTAEEPGTGWTELGSRTTARGLDLRFDHDDDPEARAFMPAPQGVLGGNSHANARTIRLAGDFAEEHVHTSGWIFRVSLRGTGSVVGKEVRLKMVVASGGEPVGGRIENDDDDDAAVGGWIEVSWAEFLKAPDRR